MPNSNFPTANPILDAHVHFVGNGSSGSGCWLRLSGFHKPLARFMLSHIGLPGNALSGDFDRLYLQALLRLIQESSIQRVVLLAHDLVYREDGTPMEGVGSFYVPNAHVLKLAQQHPEFLPAVSIHPARKDAVAELEKAVEQGAVMMKCLPNCHNIDCSLPQYRPFWKRMADLGIPLLAHTGTEKKLVHGSDFPVPIQGIWAWLRGHLSFSEWRRCARITNVLERDYQLKKAMGFSADHFSRVSALFPGRG